MSKVLAEHVTARGSWVDFVSGKPDGSQTDTSNQASISDVPVWDLRPVPEIGNQHGAQARQWARLKYLESAGALVLGNHFKGSGIIVVFKQTMMVEEPVIACQPIPLREMVPNAKPAPKGVITPLKPVGKPEFLFEK